MSKGFFLLELLLVLTLMIVCSSCLFPLLRSSCLPFELERLAMVIHYIERKARLEGNTYTVTFHDASYTADKEYIINGRFGILPGVKGPPSLPTKPLTKPITFPDQKLVCTPQGPNAGTVYLTDQASLYALTCDPSEAHHIRGYRYDKTWHRLF